jgi:4-hydroxy-tetrahydrodipicolinate synthase
MQSDERVAVYRTVAEAVEKRVPVIACIAHASTAEAHKLAARAVEVGASGIMVAPPFGAEVREKDIIAHFHDVARGLDVGIIVYNSPNLAYLSPATLAKVADEVPDVVGVKLGATLLKEMIAFAEVLGDRLSVLWGSDTSITTALDLGMAGCTSSNVSPFTELILAIRDAFQTDRWAEVRRLHRLWRPYRAFAARMGQPTTNKAVMEIRGMHGRWVRPPLRPLTAQEFGELQAIVTPIFEATGVTPVRASGAADKDPLPAR